MKLPLCEQLLALLQDLLVRIGIKVDDSRRFLELMAYARG